MTELCGERWLETGSPFMSDLERIDAFRITHKWAASLKPTLTTQFAHNTNSKAFSG